MFGQGVLGGSAMKAGTILAPILLGWPIASTLAGRLLLKIDYRPMTIFGSLTVLTRHRPARPGPTRAPALPGSWPR